MLRSNSLQNIQVKYDASYKQDKKLVNYQANSLQRIIQGPMNNGASNEFKTKVTSQIFGANLTKTQSEILNIDSQ